MSTSLLLNFARNQAVTAGVVALGALAFHHFEPGMSNVDSLYLSTVTVSTVGFGDVTPLSSEGKLVFLVLSLLGTGVFATFLQRGSWHQGVESRLGEVLPRLLVASFVLAITVAAGAIVLDNVDDGNDLELLDRVYLIVTMCVSERSELFSLVEMGRGRGGGGGGVLSFALLCSALRGEEQVVGDRTIRSLLCSLLCSALLRISSSGARSLTLTLSYARSRLEPTSPG